MYVGVDTVAAGFEIPALTTGALEVLGANMYKIYARNYAENNG